MPFLLNTPDAHSGVEGDLERGPHVLRAHAGAQLLGVDRVEDLGEERDEVLALRVAQLLVALGGLDLEVGQSLVCEARSKVVGSLSRVGRSLFRGTIREYEGKRHVGGTSQGCAYPKLEASR